MRRPSSGSESASSTRPSSALPASDATRQKQQRVHQSLQLKQQWEDIRAFTTNVLQRDAWRYDAAAYLPRRSAE